jgi:hypothetical protein
MLFMQYYILAFKKLKIENIMLYFYRQGMQHQNTKKYGYARSRCHNLPPGGNIVGLFRMESMQCIFLYPN